MNSRWNSWAACLAPALLLVTLSQGCGKKEHAAARTPDSDQVVDPAQAEAALLGREAADILDRVLAFQSAHRGELPATLRQAGLDSLTPQFIRRLAQTGNDPVISIVFRSTSGRQLTGCEGTRRIVEDLALRDGAFEVACDVIAGGRRTFTIPPPPPPKPAS